MEIIGSVIGTMDSFYVLVHESPIMKKSILFRITQEETAFGNIDNFYTNDSTSTTSYISDTFIPLINDRQNCIIIYAVLKTAMLIGILISSAVFVSVCTSSSVNLHNKMYNAVTRATMIFFNSNSSGNYTKFNEH